MGRWIVTTALVLALGLTATGCGGHTASASAHRWNDNRANQAQDEVSQEMRREQAEGAYHADTKGEVMGFHEEDENHKAHREEDHLHDKGDEARDKWAEEMENAGEHLVHGAEDLGQSAKDAGETLTQGAKDVGEDLAQGAKDLGRDAKDAAENLGQSAEHALDDMTKPGK